MKFFRILIVVLLSIALLACSAQDGKDGKNGIDGSDGKDATPDTGVGDGGSGGDATTDVIISYVLSGKLQKGPCFKDGEILIQPLNPATMYQTGSHYIGFTSDDFGTYSIPAEITEQYAEVYFVGDCHNEITGGEGRQRLDGIIKVADLVNNINPLTKIRSQVARWLFADVNSVSYQNIDASLVEAERLILLYLGMPTLNKRFTEMNLEQAGIHDAVLALSNSMILYGRSEAEQGAYIVSIANGVINNNTTLKVEIATTIDILPLIQIKNNLESRYLELGINISVPPIWNLGAPAYYADLLERTPVTLSTFNLVDNSTCSFDQSTYNTFAIPHIFDTGIETSKYIALNFTGEISIWTRGFNVYDRPGTKVLDITGLKEIILESPQKMSYNGLLGDAHGLTGGTDYYIVVRSNTNFTLSTGCEGGLLPFGRKLASQDEGLNWIGHNNTTPWFRKSGVKMFTTD